MKLIFKIMVPVILLVVITGLIAPTPDLAYSNYSGSFTFEEMNFKERNFEMCKAKFIEYKKTGSADTVLYRISTKKIWRFWQYSNYVFKEQFRLPYIDWEEIKLRRGKLEAKSGFQDF